MKQTEKTSSMSKNTFYLIIALVIMLIGIVFALQNTEETSINFFFWSFKGSLAIVIFLTFFTGIIIGVFTSIGNLMRKDRIINKQIREIEKLQNYLEEHNK